MTKSCRFSVAVHAMTLLAMESGAPLSSDWIAASVNTNPVVIRRILSALSKAGLVRTQRGSSGGAVCAKPASAVTLLDIKRAVDGDDGFGLHHQLPNQSCPVGRGIQPFLSGVFARVEQAKDAVLAETTLEQAVQSMCPAKAE